MLPIGKKSKQTKAHEISGKTKELVWQRQHGKSLFPPYKPITVEMCCCHFISRAMGGLGEEWNIFGCYQGFDRNEHRAFDRQLSEKQIVEMVGMLSDEMRDVVWAHLKENYEDITIDKCRYHKNKEIKIRRKNDAERSNQEVYIIE